MGPFTVRANADFFSVIKLCSLVKQVASIFECDISAGYLHK